MLGFFFVPWFVRTPCHFAPNQCYSRKNQRSEITTMDYQLLLIQRRTHPAWRLLAADNAPMTDIDPTCARPVAAAHRLAAVLVLGFASGASWPC